MSGGVAGGRTPAELVEQRGVPDHPSRDPLDPVVGELAHELTGGRAVPLLPGPVEAAVAQRRIAASDQIQVPVPDPAGPEVAGADHRGREAGVRAELVERGHRRVELLHRCRRPSDTGPHREQDLFGGQVVDERARLWSALVQGTRERRAERDKVWRGRGRLRRGGRPRLGGRGMRDRGSDRRVRARLWCVAAAATPGDHRRHGDGPHNPAFQADSSSSTVCGPTHATDNSSATRPATSLTSANVTSSSSAIVRSGSTSSP